MMVEPNNEDNATLFKRLSLDETLRRVCSIYSSRFAVFTKIAVTMVSINIALWTLAFMPLLRLAFGLSTDDLKDPTLAANNPGAFFALLGTNMALSIAVASVSSGSLVRVVAEYYAAMPPTAQSETSASSFLRYIKFGIKRSPVLFLAGILAMIGVMVGVLFLVLPGLYLQVAWFVVYPSAAIEQHLSAVGALKRSYNLVSGQWCYVFCTYIILMIFTMVFQMVWTLMLLGGTDYGSTVFSPVGSVVSAVPGIVTSPIFATVTTVMYFNLRTEKEGLNARVLQREMGTAAGEFGGYGLLSAGNNGDVSNGNVGDGEKNADAPTDSIV